MGWTKATLVVVFGTLLAGCGSGGAAAPSTAAGRIAFQCGASIQEFDICVMNSDGSHIQNLTRGTEPNELPKLSPDGRKIAFDHAYVDQAGATRHQLFVMNANGSGQRRVNTANEDAQGPGWSPDGRRLVYTHWLAPKGDAELWLMNADGSEPHPLTGRPEVDFDGVWANATTILFTRASTEAQTIDVYAVNSDGTHLRRLVSGGFTPAPSPHGSQFAFVCDPNIRITNLSSGKITRLTTATIGDQEPTWSPDGSQIAFRRGDNGPTSEIYVTRPDGTGEHAITRDGRGYAEPSWGTLRRHGLRGGPTAKSISRLADFLAAKLSSRSPSSASAVRSDASRRLKDDIVSRATSFFSVMFQTPATNPQLLELVVQLTVGPDSWGPGLLA